MNGTKGTLMRRMAKRLVVAAVAAGLGLAVWPASPAMAGTGNPYDLGFTWTIGDAPIGYPRGMYGYYIRPDATNWGWVGQMLPGGLADGRGQNVAPAANATGCIPAAGETPTDSLVSYSAARLETVCVLHPGEVAFQVGETHRGKNRDGYTYTTSGRIYFVRYSQTSDCLFPTVVGDGDNYRDYRNLGLDKSQEFPTSSLVVRESIPASKVGLYMCVAQGFGGHQKEYSNIPLVGVDQERSYKVRGPWTVFHIIAAGASDKPSGVVATAGNAQASVSWQFNGDQFATTAFTATSAPDGRTCRVVASKNCTVTGLRNGVAYTFTVTAERNGLRQTSDASAAVTPVDPAAGAAAAGGAGGANAAPAQPLAAARPIVLPVNGNVVQPLGAVEVTAGLSGSLAAAQTISSRTVLACFVAARGAACGNERRVMNLRPTIELQKVRVWIPSSAAGKFLRVSQTAVTSTGQVSSPAVYSSISRDSAVGANRVDPPAGADANADAPQQAGDVAAVPADGAGGAAPEANAGAGAGAAAGAGAGAAADTPAAGGDPAMAARAAGVDLAAHPIEAGGSVSMQLAASQKVNRGRFITMKAIVSPKATGGRVRIAMVRVTPQGKYVSSKSIYAPVKNGVASKRWRIPKSYTPATFTLVASYEPKGGGAGATKTVPVVIG